MNPMGRLHFDFLFDKFLAALQYLASKKSLSTLEVLKALFYADKFHLVRFGRPVTGDMYIAMDNGPVGSSSYDWLKDVTKTVRDQTAYSDKRIDRIRRAVEVKPEKTYAFFSAAEFNLSGWLSESDLEALDRGLEGISGRTIGQIIDESHGEKAWTKARAKPNAQMDLNLLFDTSDPQQMALLELLSENQEAEEFLDELANA